MIYWVTQYILVAYRGVLRPRASFVGESRLTAVPAYADSGVPKAAFDVAIFAFLVPWGVSA